MSNAAEDTQHKQICFSLFFCLNANFFSSSKVGIFCEGCHFNLVSLLPASHFWERALPFPPPSPSSYRNTHEATFICKEGYGRIDQCLPFYPVYLSLFLLSSCLFTALLFLSSSTLFLSLINATYRDLTFSFIITFSRCKCLRYFLFKGMILIDSCSNFKVSFIVNFLSSRLSISALSTLS